MSKMDIHTKFGDKSIKIEHFIEYKGLAPNILSRTVFVTKRFVKIYKNTFLLGIIFLS